MKRSYLLFLAFLLAGCETPTIDLRSEIVSAMRTNDNFVVQEEFIWRQFARKDDQPLNLDVLSTSTINFQENRYIIDHFIDEQRNQEGIQERSLYQVTTYRNIFNQQAAFRHDREWVGLQLQQLNQIGLGTIDPIDLVNQLLYQANDLYYKSEEGVTGDFEDYRYVVVSVSKELFTSLFVHNIAPYVDVPYNYRVFVELEFDETFLITSISFDFSDLIRQYTDYYTVQQGVAFTLLEASYELTYHSYGEVLNSPPATPTRLFVDGQVIINTDNARTSSRNVELRVVPDVNLTTRTNTLRFIATPLETFRILFIEVVTQEEALRLIYEQGFINPSQESQTFFEVERPETSTSYYVVVRGITTSQGRYISEIIQLDYEIEEIIEP